MYKNGFSLGKYNRYTVDSGDVCLARKCKPVQQNGGYNNDGTALVFDITSKYGRRTAIERWKFLSTVLAENLELLVAYETMKDKYDKMLHKSSPSLASRANSNVAWSFETLITPTFS